MVLKEQEALASIRIFVHFRTTGEDAYYLRFEVSVSVAGDDETKASSLRSWLARPIKWNSRTI
ncbi:hypothetical protein HYDPIDRAFT_112808 [Hydnomerulius pinastri MD-312]|uniref:Uncharacterized protein n=1 Tax=Hydnomerulius pinastri MD-312 TaxID=994086 RepID=A0A0C9W5B4_9AGAM|nr:hypothetical protein HYDPIDRAFT_120463 [Hydnomerulius pinastri MD-312]KIJ63835.1 hypothetical protein HYDPIDRAFT_112808 [Hydnomerulius pinastri MD-312]